MGIYARLLFYQTYDINLIKKGDLNTMQLSAYEKETIITFNAEEKTAEIYTADATAHFPLLAFIMEVWKW